MHKIQEITGSHRNNGNVQERLRVRAGCWHRSLLWDEQNRADGEADCITVRQESRNVKEQS